MIIKALHHVLNLLCGKGLDAFIPAWARPTREAAKGRNMLNIQLTPVDQWGFLRFCCDEEGVQNKALHFLFSFVGLRGAVTPEICHPKWNAWKRAVTAAGVRYDVLRLTIAANYGHGTKITGERATARRRFLKTYLNRQGPDYFQDLAAEIMLDRELDPVTTDWT